MFRKPHDVAASARSVQRSKEAKDLREAVLRQFPGASTEKTALDEAIPQKSLEAAKLSGSKCVAYGASADHVPLVLDLNPKSPLVSLLPTVYLLWKCPGLLPAIIVHPPVSAFVINGADLMLPGVIVAPDATLPSGSTLPDFAAGALVSVRIAGNALPFAVGRAVISSAAARGGGMRGRGVEVLHHFRDELWAAGGRTVPNAGFLPGQIVPDGDEPLASLGGGRAAPDPTPVGGAGDAGGAAAARDEDAVTGAGSVASASSLLAGMALGGDPSDAGPSAVPPEPPGASADPRRWWETATPDELLVPTLLQALRRHVRQADLPLLGSQLLGAAMAAARPAGSSLDVKRSRWRKFGAFLRAVSAGGGDARDGADVLPGVPAAALRGLLVVEEDAARGTALVRAVNREHPVLVAHKPWPATAEAGVQAPGGDAAAGGGSASSSGEAPILPPILHEWLQPSAAAAAVCSYVAAAALRARRRPLGSVAPVRGMWLAEPSLQHSGTMPEAEPGVALPQEWRALARGSAAGRPPPVLFTKAQAAAVFSEYVALRDLAPPSLPDRRTIVVDDRLADAIFGPGKGVRSHAAAAAPLSEALFPSLPPRAPAAGVSAAVSPAAEDAWGGGAGEAVDDDDDDTEDDDEEEEEAAAGGGAGLPSPLDEPPVVPDPRSALPRDDAARLWLQRLAPFYSLTFPAAASDGPGRAGGGGCVGGDVVLKRGVPPVVRVYTRKLQGGRKHTTHVAGLAPYRLAPERVAREAARAFAAAGTTGPCATDPGVTEAVLQGEWGPGVIDLLAAPPPAGFGLPRRVLSWEGEGGGGGRHKAR